MVDYQCMDLEGWLQDVTLFPAEPNDVFNYDDLLNGSSKTNEVALETDLPEFKWFDENVDLSALDSVNGFQLIPDEAQTLLLEDACNLLFDSVNSDLDPSSLSSAFQNELQIPLDLEDLNVPYQVSSPGSSEMPLSSPGYDTISEASSPASFSCASPASQVSSSDESGLSYGESSPFGVDVGSTDSTPVVSVTVCEAEADPLHLEKSLSIDELADSVRKRRFVNNGKEIPKVHVPLKNVLHPYARSIPRRRGERNERKKVQNKEAAARYRIKKRIEEKELSGEVSGLEEEQKKLKEKQDSLQSEIKYLKSLMCEILQKKGILK